MKVIETFERFHSFPHPVVTVGTFDGFHIGHRVIVESAIKRAASLNGTSILISFEPHPQTVVAPESAPYLITTKEEKLRLLEESRLDVVLILPFTDILSQLKAEHFVSQYLVQKIGVREIIIGRNHAFGRDRSGNVAELERLGRTYNFSVDAVSPVYVDGRRVSSSWIRECITKGQVEQASKLLGRPFSFSGQVARGEERGRTLTFPTANIEAVAARKLYPAEGVYAIQANVKDKSYGGMMNIGRRPTFHESDRTIEVHLFDFHEDIYGQGITIDVMYRIRDERCFDSEEELVAQIEHDKSNALQMLSESSALTEIV